MVPTSGPNAGIAFRFANMPVEAEGTGPYFTPDDQTLFISVQHPGEETGSRADVRFGDPSTYTLLVAGGQPHGRPPPADAAPQRGGRHARPLTKPPLSLSRSARAGGVPRAVGPGAPFHATRVRVNGRSSSSPGWMIPTWDSGTSFHAPGEVAEGLGDDEARLVRQRGELRDVGIGLPAGP